MKTWIPPLVALAVAIAWLAARQSAIARVERETEVLRERIVLAARGGGDEAGAGKRSLSGQMRRDKGEAGGIDWKALGESIADAQTGGMPDMRSMMKVQQQILAMDGPELAAALDEIAALEVGDEVREALEGMLIGMLAQKEPELVLDRFFDRIHDPSGGMSWQLAHAFQQWIGKEPLAAREWFDERIAAGEFESRSLDGKSRSRLQFEAAMISALLGIDPAAAGQRVGALPEEQRGDLFEQGMFLQLKPGSERAYADLVRQHVPADEQAAALSQATSVMIHQGGYERVSGFLDDIDASPDERSSIASQTARNHLQNQGHRGGVDREAVDEMRGWLGSQAPDAVDRITGEALGGVWGGDIGERVRLVEELHAEGGGDELLVGFLDADPSRQDPDAARRLAGMIVDEERRAEALRRIEEGSPVRAVPATEVIVEPAE